MISVSVFLLISAPPLRATAWADPPLDGPDRRPLRPVLDAELHDFTLPDLEGRQLTLSKQAGRVVLVHFFATWCEPCRQELAALSHLAEGASGLHITVIAVDVAEVPVRVRRFLASAPVPFPVVLDADRAVSRAWGVGILPTTYVLDSRRRPRWLAEGDIDWSRPDIRSTLEAIAAEHPQEALQSLQPQQKGETQ